MAISWQIEFDAASVVYPSANAAAPDRFPTTGARAIAFSPTTDESVICEFVVPLFLGAGTVKVKIQEGANTTTAADDSRWDVQTEYRTPGASESLNVDNFDATPDSGTITHSTTAYSLQEVTISTTPAVAPAAGDKARIKITRDADHATLDDLNVDALVTKIVVYEEV